MNRIAFTAWTLMTAILVGSPCFAASLFSDGPYQSIVSDQRSHRVGEILTVLIFEQAAAETSADTDTSKSVDVGGRVSADGVRHEASLGVDNDSAGGGSINRAASSTREDPTPAFTNAAVSASPTYLQTKL